MLFGHVLFWVGGAGNCRVDKSGRPAPIPAFLKATILKADLVLAVTALGAAVAPQPWRAMSASFYFAGIIGVSEKEITALLKSVYPRLIMRT
jgi:hypothetical protein